MSTHTGWKALLLLSIMVPTGLFTGLKLMGIGQVALETTTTLNPVAWQFNKTSESTNINNTLKAMYTDNACQMRFSVGLGIYQAPDVGLPLYRVDVEMGFATTILDKDFSVRSIFIGFGKDPQPSAIDIQSNVWSFQNLTLTAYSNGGEADIQLLGDGSSVGANCQFLVFWILYSPNNVTNSRELTYEITCFNGTAYERIIQSFDLTLLGS